MENFQISHSALFKDRNLSENPLIITSNQAEETFSLGAKLSLLLKQGSIVALNGPLGAGKTCFVKGIMSGLGIKEEITSPTYTIISEYEADISGKTIPVFHIDAFRLNGQDDFAAIGGEELIYGNGISIIEWADRIFNSFPGDFFKVNIEITGDNERLIRVFM